MNEKELVQCGCVRCGSKEFIQMDINIFECCECAKIHEIKEEIKAFNVTYTNEKGVYCLNTVKALNEVQAIEKTVYMCLKLQQTTIKVHTVKAVA